MGKKVAVVFTHDYEDIKMYSVRKLEKGYANYLIGKGVAVESSSAKAKELIAKKEQFERTKYNAIEAAKKFLQSKIHDDKYIELDFERGETLYLDNDMILKRILELYPEWEEYNIKIIGAKPSVDYMDLLVKFTGPYPYALTMNDGDADIAEGEYKIFIRCKIFK